MYLKREKGVYVFILNNRGIVGEWRLFIFGLADRRFFRERGLQVSFNIFIYSVLVIIYSF